MQYFVGMKEYQKEEPFAAALFVEIRRRMGEEMFLKFDEVIVKAVEKVENVKKSERANDDREAPKSGTLIADATAAGDCVSDGHRSVEREPRDKRRDHRRFEQECRRRKEAADVSGKGACRLFIARQKAETERADGGGSDSSSSMSGVT